MTVFGDPRLPAAFWARTRVESDGCWIWTGHLDRKGYGKFCGNSAHRIAYAALVSEAIEGLDVDHVRERGCTSRACVNPAHLEAVTHRENVQRGRSGEPQRSRTHCPRNHPYDAANTYIATKRDGTTNRQCRACKNSWRSRRLVKT